MIVWNIDELEEFFNTLLRPLDDNEVYVIWIVARKKWGSISRSEEMLDWKILRHYDFDKFYSLLQRFDVPDDAYIDYGYNRPIPKEAIGVYIDLQPKNVVKGVSAFLREFVDDMVEGRVDRIKYWDRRIFGLIHKSGKKKPYHIIDIDVKDKDVLFGVLDDLGVAAEFSWVTETRGGYHIIVPRRFGLNVHEAEKGYWKVSFVEFLKHNQTPIPGTVQGGFKVRRLNIDW